MSSHLLPLLMLAPGLAPAPQPAVMVGVLEQPCPPQTARVVRILFESSTQGWSPFQGGVTKHTPEWTLAFDGRALGTVAIHDITPALHAGAPFFTRDKLFAPTLPVTFKEPMHDGARYGGWICAPDDRPVVLVSRANAKDPDGWRPCKPANAWLRQAQTSYIAGISKATQDECMDSGGQQRAIGLADLAKHRAYCSRAGHALLTVSVSRKRAPRCDGPIAADLKRKTYLFHDGQMTAVGPGLTLVDAGDYDNDGHSELLFWASRYNEDGYVLLHDGLASQTAYLWSFH